MTAVKVKLDGVIEIVTRYKDNACCKSSCSCCLTDISAGRSRYDSDRQSNVFSSEPYNRTTNVLNDCVSPDRSHGSKSSLIGQIHLVNVIQAVFAIPGDQNVVPDHMGSHRFGTYIVVTALATFVFAYCVKSILGACSLLWNAAIEWPWWLLPSFIQRGLLRFTEVVRGWYFRVKDSYKRGRWLRQQEKMDRKRRWRWEQNVDRDTLERRRKQAEEDMKNRPRYLWGMWEDQRG
jgi:hypothetical protein